MGEWLLSCCPSGTKAIRPSKRSDGPKGQDNIAQGLPWVSQKNVSSPEGARGWGMRAVTIGSQSLPVPNGPFRACSLWD